MKIFENFYFSITKSSDDVRMLLAWLVSSTSPSGGKQVDGLPPASSTETVAKPGSLGPAQNGKLMDFVFRVNHVLLDDRKEIAEDFLSGIH